MTEKRRQMCFREGEGERGKDAKSSFMLPTTHTSLPSLHVGSFCMSDSVIPGGQNGLSLSLFHNVSHTNFLPTSPLVRLGCVDSGPSWLSIAGLCLA